MTDTIYYDHEDIIITWPVGDEWEPGDYMYLHSNSGDSSSIHWSDVHDERIYPLYANDIGYYGFGRTTFGKNAFGKGESRGVRGFGHHRFGHHTFGHSPWTITVYVSADISGWWDFGFAAYDEFDNEYYGIPDTISTYKQLRPKQPAPLVLSSYDAATDILTFEV